jgi:hypothetical protein
MGKVLVAILSILFCFPAVAQPGQQQVGQTEEITIHDGMWWKEKSGTFKEAYVIGYKEGVGHTAAGDEREVWTVGKVRSVVDGLNQFYSDPRNMDIYIEEALTYVQDRFQGVAYEALKAELQTLRQTAAARKE